MTVQEKAKTYDELLIKAKYIYNKENDVLIMHTLEDLFPELKESEDEKTERILHSISSKMSLHLHDIFTEEEFQCFDTWSNAWLEKQGQKPIIEMKTPEESLSIDSETYSEIVNDCIFGENKPKFNVGDWIIYSNEEVHLITGFDDTGYFVDKELYIPFNCEGNMQLWTIKDAKEGDVLINYDDECQFIFKGLLDPYHPNCPVAYCGINDIGEFRVSSGNYWWEDSNVKPATKEQHNLLFQKMKEAGYEWDDKNKEVKNIEQKSSAWSEEDEDFFNDTITFLEDTKNALDHADWIKSLKQRICG